MGNTGRERAQRATGTRMSKVSAWQLLDSPVGWSTRAAAAQRLRTESAEAIASAATEAAEARAELARLQTRPLERAAAAAREVANTSDRAALSSLPSRVRATLRAPSPSASSGPEPGASAPPASEVASPTQTMEVDDLSQGASAGRDLIPNLRVLHLGAVMRFGSVAGHLVIDPARWRDQLAEGADLLIVEPPPRAVGWDPSGELAELLAAAAERGLPTVRVHIDRRDDQAPGRATLELVEGIDGDLTPSIDTVAFHPRGWTAGPPDAVSVLLSREPDPAGLALLERFDPPPVLLHPADLPRRDLPPDQAPALAGPERVGRMLRRAGVLLDGGGWRTGPDDRIRGWLAAMACGTPVVSIAEDGDGLDDALPGVLRVSHARAVETAHRVLVDRDLRERLGILGRRHAHTVGARRTALLSILDWLGMQRPSPPRISVLLSTHRPSMVPRALEQIAAQSYRNVEVSLVLHGEAFTDFDLPDRGVDLRTVVRAPGDWPLGSCLNAALEGADGDLVAKMDDDDHYGPHHLEDLVIAWRHSGADVVGKRVEYVHLVERDLTLRRAPSRPERDRLHVGGPSLLAARHTLRHYGFLRLPNRVDSTLYERVLADGGRIYGTHSRDLVLARHGDHHGHAWDVADGDLLEQAFDTRPGCDLGLASSEVDDSVG